MLRSSFISSLAVVMVTGCATDGDPSSEPAEDFVFGLSADEVLAAKRVAQQPMSDDAWLDAHRGAFDCARHGDLCAKVGPTAAAHAIELGYRLAIEGAERAEIVRAQDEAVAAARPAWRELGLVPYDSDTECSAGTGADDRRLCAKAWASLLWPVIELQADAECYTQVDIAPFGWWSLTSDRVCGSMRATFNNGQLVINRANSCVTSTSQKTFTSFQIAASNLTTVVSCHAEQGLWVANRSADVSID